MSLENLLATITSIGGGFLAGIMLGYFLKKVIKIIIFAAGGIVALLSYFQQVHIISVNIEKLEGSFTFLLNSVISTLSLSVSSVFTVFKICKGSLTHIYKLYDNENMHTVQMLNWWVMFCTY